MSIISEVKCGRCDRHYSGLRSRCPYCGAHRSKKGKYANGTENSKGKLIVASLVVLVLVVAVAVLLISSISKNNNSDLNSPVQSTIPSGGGIPGSDDVITTSDTPALTEPTDSAPPSYLPTIPPTTVDSVGMYYAGELETDFTLTHIGDTITLKCKTIPADTTLTPIWTSSDPSVFSVIDGKVTAIGKGAATLTLAVGDKQATCIVRVLAG